MQEFENLQGQGLFYKGEYICDDEPKLSKIIENIDMDSGLKHTSYMISILKSNGELLPEKEVDSLKDIPCYEMWGCPDAMRNRKQKMVLEYKLQKEAANTEKEKCYLCSQGIYEDDEGKIFMVFGDKILRNEPEHGGRNIRISNPYGLRGNALEPALCMVASKEFLKLSPGVTEMLFYGSMLAVVRPYLHSIGYKPDFLMGLVGPSGHLKTTLVRKYALWLKDSEKQEVTFRDYGRFEEVLKKVDRLAGQNFLVDDLHNARSRSGSERQEERLDNLCRYVSSRAKCAQVFITGEKVENLGVFSCLDRILQIKISKKDSESLADLKRNIGRAKFEYIPSLALAFADALIKNQESVKTDIDEFFSQNQLCDNKDYSLRIAQHALYLKLTEMLYRKYLLQGSEEYSCKKELNDAIDINYDIQSCELKALRKEEEFDVIVELYKMLTGHVLVRFNDTIQYQLIITSCEAQEPCYCASNGKIYITQNNLQTGMYKHLRRACSAKKISDAMHDVGILEEDNDARTKKFGGKRHYFINYELLKYYYEQNS